MNTLLNYVNRVSDTDATYLYNYANREDNDADAFETVFLSKNRRLVLFISHNRYLVAFGFVSNALVWFSYTPVSDILLTRRVFDCMKIGAFYRKVEPEIVLNLVGMAQRDLYRMCRTDVIKLEDAHPIFSGSIVSQPPTENQPPLTGVEFANLIAVMPQRFENMIASIGTDDDIIIELEKDFKRLTALSSGSVGSEDDYCYKEAMTIRDKWRKAECLNMAERATIRGLYGDICWHPFVTPNTTISEMLGI